MKAATEICGTVRNSVGQPLAGVLVTALDLAYAETGEDGSFRIPRPEMALIFWCTGFRPLVRLIDRPATRLDVTLDKSY